jgi:quercetin dioxygenase-like cupin family protein
MPITVYTPSSILSEAAPASNFMGAVRLTQLLATSEAPSHQHAASVTFPPCATSSWHYHPLGQLIVGTLGMGLVTEWGGQPKSIAPGDVVWISPDTKHWHGAQASGAFSQIAITEGDEADYTTEWLVRATRSSPCVVDAATSDSSTLWWQILALSLALVLVGLLLRTWLQRRKSQHLQASLTATMGTRQETLLSEADAHNADSSSSSPV